MGAIASRCVDGTSRRQRGAVLFVCLVILLILTPLAIVTVNSSLAEAKMVSGMRNMQLASFAANSALSEAKSRISRTAKIYGADKVCQHIVCAIRTPESSNNAADFMKSEAAKIAMCRYRLDMASLNGADESAKLAESPTYVIEDIGSTKPDPDLPGTEPEPASHDFRITVRAVGATDTFSKVLETVYSVSTQSGAS